VFHPCNASSIGKRNQYSANLDRMCQEALNITDAGLIPDRNLQTVFLHIVGDQGSKYRHPERQPEKPQNVELFTRRLALLRLQTSVSTLSPSQIPWHLPEDLSVRPSAQDKCIL